MDESLGFALDDYMNARRDYESGRAGSALPEVPEALLDGLEAGAYIPTQEGREMREIYWQLMDHVAEQAKRDYDNGDLPADSLVKSILDESKSDRRRFELSHSGTSKLLTDRAARIADFHPEPGSEDARRIKELKRETDVAICILNGGGENVLHGSYYKNLPFDSTCYDIMGSMGYGPFMWEGGAPADDKAPAFISQSSAISTGGMSYAGGPYDNIPWEDSAYEAKQNKLRGMYGPDERVEHFIYDQAKNNPPTPHDRLMGTAELFRAVGDIGDVRQIWKNSSDESRRLGEIFDDYNAAVVCCNLHTQAVNESRMYASDYHGIEGSLSDVMGTVHFIQSPVDEWGYQVLHDLGHKEIACEELDFCCDGDYTLKPGDVQQLRMDRAFIDFYAGYDDRNGKLVTQALTCLDGPTKWDMDLATDYVENELDKMLDPGGDSPKARALREQLFDQVSAAEVLLTAGGNVEDFRKIGEPLKIVDDACYERLKSYGYENPMLSGMDSDGRVSETEMPESRSYRPVMAHNQNHVARPDRHVEMPEEFKRSEGSDVQYE